MTIGNISNADGGLFSAYSRCAPNKPLFGSALSSSGFPSLNRTCPNMAVHITSASSINADAYTKGEANANFSTRPSFFDSVPSMTNTNGGMSRDLGSSNNDGCFESVSKPLTVCSIEQTNSKVLGAGKFTGLSYLMAKEPNGIDFSSLAASAASRPFWEKKTVAEDVREGVETSATTSEVIWAGAGTQLFSSPSKHMGTASGATDAEDVNHDPHYDPHYEPIIELPKLVQVSFKFYASIAFLFDLSFNSYLNLDFVYIVFFFHFK
ncbi:unnamed protein product [Protopolystoma xenopodis]|uniref:Uncharacterized protein n=1 Tax=Protopolystoma xenopodis TaxID=117903 RepID=A0A3S5CRD4_9PLAT|nr:unnamed protein product [Protopolystoma xenopodis]